MMDSVFFIVHLKQLHFFLKLEKEEYVHTSQNMHFSPAGPNLTFVYDSDSSTRDEYSPNQTTTVAKH